MTNGPGDTGGAEAEIGADPMAGALDDAVWELVEDAVGGREIWVLNGVNLGRLGRRDPRVYGSTTHAELTDRLTAFGRTLGLVVRVRQTDVESEMIGWLHQAADASIPVVLNPAAWSHYSVALRDAVDQRTADLVEVHLSNIHAREEFRHHSVISAVASGVIAGLGIDGYELALRFIAGRG